VTLVPSKQTQAQQLASATSRTADLSINPEVQDQLIELIEEAIELELLQLSPKIHALYIVSYFWLVLRSAIVHQIAISTLRP
jgi:hypothetical protein